MSMEKYKKVRHVTRYSPFRYTICYTLHDTPLLLHDMLPVTRYSTFVTRYVTRYAIFPFSYTMCYPSHDIPPFLLDTLNVTRYSTFVPVVYHIFVSSLSILETSCKIVKMSLFIHLMCQFVTSSLPLSSSLRSILDSRQWLERNAENHIKTKPNRCVTLSHPHYESENTLEISCSESCNSSRMEVSWEICSFQPSTAVVCSCVELQKINSNHEKVQKTDVLGFFFFFLRV